MSDWNWPPRDYHHVPEEGDEKFLLTLCLACRERHRPPTDEECPYVLDS